MSAETKRANNAATPLAVSHERRQRRERFGQRCLVKT